MGFYFKRKERVAKAISRLGCERIERARECLRDASKTEAIHGARKEIKRARAVLRLARANISKKEFCRLRKDLQKAGACLAKPRDAAVKAKTLRDLMRRFKGELPQEPFRQWRVKLGREARKQMQRFVDEGKLPAVDRILGRAAKDFQRPKIQGNGWAALAPGMKAAYRDCRDAYRCALKTNSAEDFHEWRKRAKELWYQLKLLEPISPETIARMAGELESVGECLGEDHDLFLLQETLMKSGAGKARELKKLGALVDARQEKLRAKALEIGKSFYVEKPAGFCKRLGSYWRAWQKSERMK